MVEFTKQQLYSLSKQQRKEIIRQEQQQQEQQKIIQQQQAIQQAEFQKIQEEQARISREAYEWDLAEKVARGITPVVAVKHVPSIMAKVELLEGYGSKTGEMRARQVEAEGAHYKELMRQLEEKGYGGMTSAEGGTVFYKGADYTPDKPMVVKEPNILEAQLLQSRELPKYEKPQSYITTVDNSITLEKIQKAISGGVQQTYAKLFGDEFKYREPTTLEKTPFGAVYLATGRTGEIVGRQITQPLIERTGYTGIKIFQEEKGIPQKVTIGGEFKTPSYEYSLVTPQQIGFLAEVGTTYPLLMGTGAIGQGALFVGGAPKVFNPKLTITERIFGGVEAVGGAYFFKRSLKNPLPFRTTKEIEAANFEKNAISFVGETQELGAGKLRQIIRKGGNQELEFVGAFGKETAIKGYRIPETRVLFNKQGGIVKQQNIDYLFAEKGKLFRTGQESFGGGRNFRGVKLIDGKLAEAYLGTSSEAVLGKSSAYKTQLFQFKGDLKPMTERLILGEETSKKIGGNFFYEITSGKGSQRLASQKTINFKDLFPEGRLQRRGLVWYKTYPKRFNYPKPLDLEALGGKPFSSTEWAKSTPLVKTKLLTIRKLDSTKIFLNIEDKTNPVLFSRNLKSTDFGFGISEPIKKQPFIKVGDNFKWLSKEVKKSSFPTPTQKVLQEGGGGITSIADLNAMYPPKSFVSLKEINYWSSLNPEQPIVYPSSSQKFAGIVDILKMDSTPTPTKQFSGFGFVIPKQLKEETVFVEPQVFRIMKPSKLGNGLKLEQSTSLELDIGSTQRFRLGINSKPLLEAKSGYNQKLELGQQLKQKLDLGLKQQLKQQQKFSFEKALETKTPKITAPSLIHPPTIINTPKSVPKIKQLLRKLPKTKLYTVLTKRRGVWKQISPQPLPKGKALQFGSVTAEETLAARFKLQEAGFGEAKDIPFTVGRKFRPFRISKGKRIPLKDEFIQKRKFRLGTKGEVSEIMRTKKSKRRIKLL